MSDHLVTLHKTVKVWVRGESRDDVESALGRSIEQGLVDGWSDGEWQITRVGVSSCDPVDVRYEVVDGVVVPIE